ncbi:hypothetical protein FBQ97_16665, partial [Acidobacteria bacterium ACD]|nr:hypothetical protein [Acidobacteria bacterium ACD]
MTRSTKAGPARGLPVAILAVIAAAAPAAQADSVTPPPVPAAINALNGKNVDGRDLTVNEAKPRENRGGGGGG